MLSGAVSLGVFGLSPFPALVFLGLGDFDTRALGEPVRARERPLRVRLPPSLLVDDLGVGGEVIDSPCRYLNDDGKLHIHTQR